jgi:hypothetical protein
MSYAVFVRRSIIFGTAVSVSGIVLYSQLANIVNLHVSLSVLNTAATLSLSMTLLGLLAILVGSVAWARRAPLVNLLWAEISTGVATLLLAVLSHINVHGPTAILMFVVVAGALDCILILLVAADRGPQQNKQE